MRHPTKKFFAAGLLADVLSLAGCGTVDKAACDDVRVLEAQLATVEGSWSLRSRGRSATTTRRSLPTPTAPATTPKTEPTP